MVVMTYCYSLILLTHTLRLDWMMVTMQTERQIGSKTVIDRDDVIPMDGCSVAEAYRMAIADVEYIALFSQLTVRHNHFEFFSLVRRKGNW